MNKLFKVERQHGNTNNWYEVMMSPFSSSEEVHAYLLKYSKYYPKEESYYRITKDLGNSKIIKYFNKE
jgi:hypothetical protein